MLALRDDRRGVAGGTKSDGTSGPRSELETGEKTRSLDGFYGKSYHIKALCTESRRKKPVNQGKGEKGKGEGRRGKKAARTPGERQLRVQNQTRR